MPNLVQTLKEEIARLARKEVKGFFNRVHKDTVVLKKVAAKMKRQIASLERESRQIKSAVPAPAAAAVSEEESGKLRVTAKGVRSLRSKLGLARGAFARLVGATSQSVYNWEKQNGVLRLRGTTKAALLGLRGVGVREARARLDAQAEAKRPPKATKAPKGQKPAKAVKAPRAKAKRGTREA